tara:strand:- start:6633 stop:7019 length:387 start_codon:yes stop_codon:yes gene_type:complete
VRVTHLELQKKSRRLVVTFAEQDTAHFSFEFLRVYSPSADVKSQSNPVLHKQNISISAIEAVGHYALRIQFDDGHGTGLYSWDYLAYLARHQHHLWQNYLDRVKKSQGSRSERIPLRVTYIKKFQKKT